MARPRVFVSSTYYDLRHIRAVLESFVIQVGYEPVLFEKGDIPFFHDKTLEESCLKEVDGADILILIIGGRYGSLSPEDQEALSKDRDKFFSKVRSVTRREYEKARDRDIPIYIFVDDNVLAEYKTYQENRTNNDIRYAHVDDVNIYRMLDDIFIQRRNNFVKGFARHEDITSWLRDQWAGMFSDALKQRHSEIQLRNLETQIRDLADTVSSLKSYSEAIVKAIDKGNSGKIIQKVNRELRDKQVRSFLAEPFTNFIKQILGEIKTDVDNASMYRAFISAGTYEEFLGLLNVSKDDKDFLKAFEPAKRDFAKLKKKYNDADAAIEEESR